MLVLTGCGADTADILVYNRSAHPVRVQLWGRWPNPANGIPLNEVQVPPGLAAAFSVDAGRYRVRVTTAAGRDFWFWESGQTTLITDYGDILTFQHGINVLRGLIRLDFHGNRITRRS